MISLFEALFTLLAQEGPAVRPEQVNAILADPECMAEQAAALRQQMADEESHVNPLSIVHTTGGIDPAADRASAGAQAEDECRQDHARAGEAHGVAVE